LKRAATMPMAKGAPLIEEDLGAAKLMEKLRRTIYELRLMVAGGGATSGRVQRTAGIEQS
jgi:hypothetical protein